MGAHATVGPDGDRATTIRLTAMLATRDGRVLLRRRDTDGDPEALGRRVARHLLDDAGGADLLSEIRP